MLGAFDASVVQVKGIVNEGANAVFHRTVGFLLLFQPQNALFRVVGIPIIRSSGGVRVVGVFDACQAKAIGRVMAAANDVDARPTVQRLSLVVEWGTNEICRGLLFRADFFRGVRRRPFNYEKTTCVARTGGRCFLRGFDGFG